MSAIWENSGDGWSLLEPSGFPDEKTLHDLVEDAPHLLPLSGSPRLVIVGREVLIGGGSADLVAVEPDGRVAIIEIKLKQNSEARRAVVAQVLSYAAALAGLDAEAFERDVLSGHLGRRGFNSLPTAVETSYDGPFNPSEFSGGLDDSLRTGAFRLVLVLDEAPADLVRLLGFLEAKTHGLIIDLVTVAAHRVGGSQLIVPTRVEPSRETSAATKRVGSATARVVITEGSADFRSVIADALPECREDLNRLANWADDLERQGLARLSTNHDPRGWKVLRVWLPGQDRGFATLWYDRSPSIQLWRSVLESVAPDHIASIETAAGFELPARASKSTRDITPALLESLHSAYRAAATAGRG
jgi:hypothetical protein